MINQIHNLDCREGLQLLAPNSIDCVITSPPYWGLRDYGVEPSKWDDGWEGCLGQEPTPELFVKHIADIYDQVKWVLKKEGTCWLNLDDTYRKKCLQMIPQRVALEMTSRGWILRNVIVWHKPNCKPESVKDRFTVDFEYVYFFTKNKKYFFNQLRNPHKEVSKKRAMRGVSKNHKNIKNNPYPKGMKQDSMFKERKHQGYDNMDKKIKEGKTILHPLGSNKRTVWKISYKPNKEAHFAVFPPKLTEPMIKSGCPEDGIVLDPFAGIGNTLIQTKKMGRNYIGFEISEKYCKIAERLLSEVEEK